MSKLRDLDIKLGRETISRSEILYKYLLPDQEPLAALGTATLLMLRLYHNCTRGISLPDFAENVKQGLISFDDCGALKDDAG